jgi:hypothetical protein
MMIRDVRYVVLIEGEPVEAVGDVNPAGSVADVKAKIIEGLSEANALPDKQPDPGNYDLAIVPARNRLSVAISEVGLEEGDTLVLLPRARIDQPAATVRVAPR